MAAFFVDLSSKNWWILALVIEIKDANTINVSEHNFTFGIVAASEIHLTKGRHFRLGYQIQ